MLHSNPDLESEGDLSFALEKINWLSSISALQTGHSLLECDLKSHFIKQDQQYRWPQGVMTGS